MGALSTFWAFYATLRRDRVTDKGADDSHFSAKHSGRHDSKIPRAHGPYLDSRARPLELGGDLRYRVSLQVLGEPDGSAGRSEERLLVHPQEPLQTPAEDVIAIRGSNWAEHLGADCSQRTGPHASAGIVAIQLGSWRWAQSVQLLYEFREADSSQGSVKGAVLEQWKHP
jgi:hypothetical protein